MHPLLTYRQQRTMIIYSPPLQDYGHVVVSLSDDAVCPCSPTVKQSVTFALFFRKINGLVWPQESICCSVALTFTCLFPHEALHSSTRATVYYTK